MWCVGSKSEMGEVGGCGGEMFQPLLEGEVNGLEGCRGLSGSFQLSASLAMWISFCVRRDRERLAWCRIFSVSTVSLSFVSCMAWAIASLCYWAYLAISFSNDSRWSLYCFSCLFCRSLYCSFCSVSLATSCRSVTFYLLSDLLCLEEQGSGLIPVFCCFVGCGFCFLNHEFLGGVGNPCRQGSLLCHLQ